MPFANKLKDLREQNNFTQQQIADKLGIKQPSYANWEKGIKMPSRQNLEKVASLFEVTTDYLLDNDELFAEIDKETQNFNIAFRANLKDMDDEDRSTFLKEMEDFMKERADELKKELRK